MIKVIKTEEEYKSALNEIEALMDKDPDPESHDGELLELLSTLVQTYEAKRFPVSAPDPIDAILYRMEEQKLTPRDLIPYIGSRSKVSEILSRKRPLTVTMMRALQAGLGIPARILLQESDQVENNVTLDRFPLREMEKNDYFGTRLPRQLEKATELVGAFFNAIGSFDRVAVLFRKSNYVRSARAMNKYALMAWAARVVNKARNERFDTKYRSDVVTPEYMQEIVKLSQYEDGPVRAREFLKQSGIALIVEPHLSHTYLDGAAIMICKDRPIIGLTIRHDRIDNFWFCLMHELAHICLHSNQETNLFYDDLDAPDLHDKREQEADALAGEVLVPQKAWDSSPAKVLPSAEAAEDLARTLNVHPAIIAGKMRYERKHYRRLHQLVGYGQVSALFPEAKRRK